MNFKEMPYLKEIIKEMCKRVDAKFSKLDFESSNWYLKYSWTEEEEDKFKEWLVKFLTNNSNARKEIMNFPIKDKKMIEKTCNYFIFNYGWKLKEKKEELKDERK